MRVGPVLALLLFGCDDDAAREQVAVVADAGVDRGVAAAPDAAPLADAAAPDLGPRPSYSECFADIGTDELGVDFEQFGPVVGRHCLGTDHQTIDGIERVVFLGDSVTTGTPPARPPEWYREQVVAGLQIRFGDDLEVAHCAAFGARTDDLLLGKGEIPECFPETPDPRRTLVIFTVGGNDIAAWAQDGLTREQALVEAERAADLLEEAVAWFGEPGRFPNGVSLIYATPFEYTDATGDLESCELSGVAGLEGNWIEGADAVIRFQERFMETAVRHQVDLVFTLEHFCGHGFHHDDSASPCYRGPEAELWFDLTCIHPNAVGHARIAEMFLAVVDE